MTAINSKVGVNLNAPNQAKPENTGASNLTAADKEKMGADNVGDYLNKMVDANYMDPAKKPRSVGNPNLDKDAFFKLMMAQMKNQDPTNPLKSHEMAAQLANFSSLEQMQNMNKSLDELKNAQKPSENFQALNLIGKAVAGDSSRVTRGLNDKDHDFKFNLSAGASDVKVLVRDSLGKVVRTYDLKNLKAGDNKITWNGEDENGMKAASGEYQFLAEAKGADGKKLALKTEFDGVITGVSYSPEGPVLHVGNQTIRFMDVAKITDPRLKNNDQKAIEPANLDLKKDDAAGQTKKEESVELQKASTNPAPVAKSDIIANLGLPREVTRIAKEMEK